MRFRQVDIRICRNSFNCKPYIFEMNIKRFTVALRVALFGHIFNWMWQPKDVRRRRRGYVTAKAVLDYLQHKTEKDAVLRLLEPLKQGAYPAEYTLC